MMKIPLERRFTAAAIALVGATVVACGTDTVTPPPVVTPALSAVAVTPSSVQGGAASTGTVTLTVAPTAGLPVALSSSNGAATVPATVTVNSAATSATFPITTNAVAADTSITITGTLNGTARTATLMLTAPPVVNQPPPPPPPVAFAASLKVTSLSAAKRKLKDNSIVDVPGKGAGSANSCPVVIVGGDIRLDCEFDASASTSPTGISNYRFKWRLNGVDGDSGGNANTNPKFRPIVQPCSFVLPFINNGTNDDPVIQMPVTVEVRNPANQTISATVSGVNVFPAGVCGYPF